MLILATESVTRKTLLAGAGIAFETRPAGIDERAVENATAAAGATAGEIARQLAMAKAEAVAAHYPDAVVIGADQVLSFEGNRLHKPRDIAEARVQLASLRGHAHHLHTGVAVALAGRTAWSHVSLATLVMRQFSDAERDRILQQEGEAALASVGGYRLEGPSVQLFETIEGDYFSILGLPLLPLLGALRTLAPNLFEEAAA